jgi:hypothetical protein
MTRTRLQSAVNEANRFIRRAEALGKAYPPLLKEDMAYGSGFGTCKESGAVRRASMDLTRALARLRASQ